MSWRDFAGPMLEEVIDIYLSKVPKDQIDTLISLLDDLANESYDTGLSDIEGYRAEVKAYREGRE